MRKSKKILSCLLGACMVVSMAGCSSQKTGKTENTGVETSAKENTKTKEEADIPSEEIEVKQTVTVSPVNMSQTNGGVFEGWGTSLCWWANRLGYSDELAQQAADAFFGEDGLRFNIMRYNIGGGDDPTHKHITRTDSAIPGWLVYDETAGEYVYDYEADKNQLNVLERAVEAAGEDAYVEVFQIHRRIL